MDFKRIIVAILLFTGCGADKKGTGVIGTPLSQITGIDSTYGIESTEVFFIDKQTRRLLGLNLESFQLAHEFELKEPNVEHSLAVDTNQRFVVDFSTKHLEVISMDGNRYPNPLSFQGTPVSAAYNPVVRYMVMQDNLKSIGFLQLSEAGSIAKSWLGGPTIADGKTISAGDIDKNGRLILAMTDKSFSIVDIDLSITQQSWQFETFTTDLYGINWVAPDNNVENAVLVGCPTVVAVLNPATKTIVEQKDIPSGYSIVGQSKAGRPHIIVQNSLETVVYYVGANGQLAQFTLARADMGQYSDSYFRADAKELTVRLTTSSVGRILKVRLSDSLVLFDGSFSNRGSSRLGGDKLFINYNTGLGAVELRNLTDSSVKRLEGYNFEYLRQRASQ